MIHSFPLLCNGAGAGGRIARSVVVNSPSFLGDVDLLPQALTIGGAAYDPCAYMVADDINPVTGAWVSRHSATKVLSLTGSGAAPTYQNNTAISNYSTIYGNAKYHVAPDTTFGQITTGDFALEAILINNAVTNKYEFGTYPASTPIRGYMIYHDSSGNLSFYMADGGVGVFVLRTLVPAASLVAGGIYHIMVICDMSDSVYHYVNGAYLASNSTTSFSLNMSALPLFLGKESLSGILEYALWDLPSNPFPGAATNRAVMDKIAADRFAVVSGIKDSMGTTYSFSRSTAGYVDRFVSTGVRRCFVTTPGWPRVCERSDGTTQAYGYLPELQCTNDFLYSDDFAQAATWVPTRCSVSSNGIQDPDAGMTADGIIASSDANTHYVEQTIAGAVSDHVFSVWAKKGAMNWIKIEATLVANAHAYFNLNSGVIGTQGAGVHNVAMEDWGNGWYRCSVCYTGGVASHAHRIFPAEADGDETFSGDDVTVSIYVWGAQHEDDGEDQMSSYIRTTTGAATRVKDVLTRTISGMTTGKYTLSADFYDGEAFDNELAKSVLSIDDATANNAITIGVTTGDGANTVVTTGGVEQANITGSTDITDGNWHEMKATAVTNLVRQKVDGAVDGTDDTSATTPTGMTVLRIGCSTTSNTGQPGGLIRNIKVLKDVF